ncbi:Serine-threonine/tyrosine-protein kinase, catalytic domain [Dillenia turbinata]|uniref:Serine-threonine/tyrosine-protein kinase, catalytic domain n=1 Tax=Dillenia turbinata TaxID=194707 RepID=A0AAN8ZA22_9MAGN
MAIISSKQTLFLLFSLLHLVAITISQLKLLYSDCINDYGNYTSNSTYKQNLDQALSIFTASNSSGNGYGFFNVSVGENTEKVNAIALCRGDVELASCRSCLNDSNYKLLQVCPNQKEAIGGYDNCMLRYSNRSILSKEEKAPWFYVWNLNNISNVDEFNQQLDSLLNNLKNQAASGNSLRKYATGNASFDSQTIYGLVQCTPDLTETECNDCVGNATNHLPKCCDGRQGGRVIFPSCNIRYEINQFYNSDPYSSPASPPSPSPPSTNTTGTEASPPSPSPPSTNTTGTEASPPSPSRTEGNKSSKSSTVIIIVVVAVAISAILLIIMITFNIRKTKQKKEIEDDNVDTSMTVESLQYDFETVKQATENFSDANKLGQGGFGAVYKGRIPNGPEIAVKRLSQKSGLGEIEFKNEVMLVAKLQHRNLVRLLGFSLKGQERLLIYEYVPNTSLDNFIFDPMKQEYLNWETRYKIIVGIARGLLYLHEDSRFRIIHRDLKASNVLLDNELNPKISDFGMARLVGIDQTQANTSRIVGTYGYMAPEYAMHGLVSVKSDVYSFGVLILEIISGQRISSFCITDSVEDLISYAWKSWREGTAFNVVDPTLRGASRNEIMRCIHLGLLCVQASVADRPNMANVVLMLSCSSYTLPVPSQPGYFARSSSGSSSSSNVVHSQVRGSNISREKPGEASVNEVSISEPYPR